MSIDSIPADIGELTPEWVTAALRQAGHVRAASVTHVDCEAIGEGRGFTGSVVRLRLEYDIPEDGAPKSLVAKLPSPDAAIRAQLSSLGVYERELGFYTDIAGPGVPVPRSFYAHMDREDGMSILLLEDLDFVRPGDNVAGCSNEDAFLAVSRLARFHAAWWEHPRLDELHWLVPVDADRFQALLQAVAPTFLERSGVFMPDRLRVLVQRLADNGAYYRQNVTAHPHTIVHGDFRLDNLLFGQPDGEAALTIIDWQVSLLGRGVADVAYFAAFCLDKDQRRAIERHLVSIYHSALLANSVHGYTADQCWADYRFATLTALARLITAGGILDVSSERGRALTSVLIDRIDAILADHNVGELLPVAG